MCSENVSSSSTSSSPSTSDLGAVIVKLSCNLNASYGGVPANVAAQSSTSIVDRPRVLTDQPASAVGSERIALVDVDPASLGRWSTRFSHARVPIAVFKNLQLLHVLHVKLSCFLDHLRIQRQSSARLCHLGMRRTRWTSAAPKTVFSSSARTSLSVVAKLRDLRCLLPRPRC